ncbi:MAG: GPW/gp25 family protein [Lachnospiraceae bacterium]|nr:GPW/gp25 family protein [Lachnospiraceae bacterium]
MDDNHAKEFLGRGFSFPIRVDKNTGEVQTSGREENIEESIRIILNTRRGERIRNPRFGCGIWDYAFATMDYTSLSSMKREVEMALVRWEPRIEDIEVTVEPLESEGRVLFHIRYVVRGTNNPFNMVFPFYINEGYGG